MRNVLGFVVGLLIGGFLVFACGCSTSPSTIKSDTASLATTRDTYFSCLENNFWGDC